MVRKLDEVRAQYSPHLGGARAHDQDAGMATKDRHNHHFLTFSGSPVFMFRTLVVGIMLSTGIGVTYAILNRSAFVESFPGAATPTLYGAFLVVAAMGLVALIGLWGWRRWALVLYALVAVASLALDRLAGAPLIHELAVLTGAAAVFSLAYLNRRHFRQSPGFGAT